MLKPSPLLSKVERVFHATGMLFHFLAGGVCSQITRVEQREERKSMGPPVLCFVYSGRRRLVLVHICPPRIADCQ